MADWQKQKRFLSNLLDIKYLRNIKLGDSHFKNPRAFWPPSESTHCVCLHYCIYTYALCLLAKRLHFSKGGVRQVFPVLDPPICWETMTLHFGKMLVSDRHLFPVNRPLPRNLWYMSSAWWNPCSQSSERCTRSFFNSCCPLAKQNLGSSAELS